MPPERPRCLDDDGLRLLLLGGKGGVGKTTCAAAAALAIARARADASCLLISTDPAHSLGDCEGLGDRPANLAVRELDAAACLTSFRATHGETLGAIAARGTFLDASDAASLLDLSLPGLDELMGFLELTALAADGQHDCIIVDTAPTGHSLRLLEMPDLLDDWLHALDALLAKERYMRQVLTGRHRHDRLDAFLLDQAGRIKAMRRLLRDPRRCAFVPVLLAESPSTAETARLLDRLGRLQIPVRELIVNRWLPGSDADHGRQQQIIDAFSDRLAPEQRLWCLPLLDQQPGTRVTLNDWLAQARPLARMRPTATICAGTGTGAVVENPAPLPERLLHLFAGKGGVGKTTLACATALRLAEASPDQPILLLSCDPAHSLGDLLRQSLGAEPTAIAPGLMAIELDPTDRLDALRRDVADDIDQHFNRLSPGLDLPFDRDATQRLLDLRPAGLDELIALLAVIDAVDAKRYRGIVLDTAPSGHLLRLLELPQLVEDWLRRLFGLFLKYPDLLDLPRIKARLVDLSKRIKALRALLTDHRRTAVYAVAQPQPMVLAETTRLIDACTRLGLRCPVVLHNRLIPGDADQHQAVDAFAADHPDQHHSRIPQQPYPQIGSDALASLGAGLWQVRPIKRRPPRQP